MFCIYHDNCIDGFTAAWAVHLVYPTGVTFYAAKYGSKPPLHLMDHQTDVVIVDFSYPRDQLLLIGKVARSVLVLDHHKTAMEELSGFDACPSTGAKNNMRSGDLKVLFDMHRSGAGIAWDYFHDDRPRPKLIHLVEDRDLWKFQLRGAKELHEVLSLNDKTFETWGGTHDDLESDEEQVFRRGAVLLRKHRQLVNAAVENSWMMDFEGFYIPVANAAPNLASDVGNDLAVNHPFAMVYIDGPDGRSVSLRSAKPVGVDVSAIAKKYGGGGHKHAAGFKIIRPMVL